MRVCASVGVFTEDSQGKFGPTPLSDVLTADSPVSVKIIAQEAGGLWLRMWTALPDGMPQSRQIVGMEWWDYLKANPKEMETFGEAMKSNSLNSMRGVLEKCDQSRPFRKETGPCVRLEHFQNLPGLPVGQRANRTS